MNTKKSANNRIYSTRSFYTGLLEVRHSLSFLLLTLANMHTYFMNGNTLDQRCNWAGSIQISGSNGSLFLQVMWVTVKNPGI